MHDGRKKEDNAMGRDGKGRGKGERKEGNVETEQK